LAEKLKFWSSKLVVREGDVLIDISLATKGMSSTVPKGTQHKTFPYPGTFYWFNTCIFHGQDTGLDSNKGRKSQSGGESALGDNEVTINH
jgi:hypothetical protein